MTAAAARVLAGGCADVLEWLEPGTGVWIGGEGRAASDGEVFEVLDPASGDVVARVASATPADARAAADCAAAAARDWSRVVPRSRSDILHDTYRGIRARKMELAALVCLESGKLLHDALAEVEYAADFVRWYAEEAHRDGGQYARVPRGAARNLVHFKPVGVSLLVTPWNFPAAMVTRKLAPALAAGCTTVVKPASETPLTALALVRIFEEAGLPPGAANLVPTASNAAVVAEALAHPAVRKLSFTGSTAVGRLLLSQASGRVLNASMELGGNAPFVIATDADLDAAVAGAMVAKMRNNGQACTAANRFFVHTDVAKEFAHRLAKEFADLELGSASSPTATASPVISAAAAARINGLVDEALSVGAERLTPASPVSLGSCFVDPTVLYPVDPAGNVVQQEIFGPVAPIVTWEDEGTLVTQINEVDLGLASYIYCADVNWAISLAERIDAGMVGINRGTVSDVSMPFGGVKESGLGREGGNFGIRAFQEPQFMSIGAVG